MLRAVASAAVAAVLLLSPPGLAQDAGGTATALAANGDALDATPLDLAAVTEDDSALVGRELLGRRRRPRCGPPPARPASRLCRVVHPTSRLCRASAVRPAALLC